MRIDRRELLRQFGATAAASVLLPSVVEPASASAEGTDIVAKLDSNENAYGPSEKAKEALHQAAGAWKDKDHPELKEGAVAWTKTLRRESEVRFKKQFTAK